MKGAAQPPMLQAPKSQIGAAVRAGTLQQPIAAIVVTKQHQIFAEQPNRLDPPVAGQLIDKRGGLPIATHQVAGRSAGPGAGNEIILIRAEHAEFLFIWLRSVSSNLQDHLRSRPACAAATDRELAAPGVR